ncbi:dicarboxylate/amino acid:cation symporter [Halanaerobium praevalens]|uniref:Sodium:dicarboxylate symporter n=1 Tax=Halanaerobium praevalens (strain ATCC 33744 / DSM 2228 / GSL) TaxID=572479 RepID=E3DR39_HALPG|nr:dicarboxylate/amino acid:cation symporter [Halanaerobium praevalens]ADO78028.1 sodium:dicarboxylate symporter [Halanaerobium praevalens DSM 2228]
MKKKKITDHLVFRLLIAVTIGVILGVFVEQGLMQIISTIKYVLGQLIFYSVPLVIIGFIAPSITKLQEKASKLLGQAVSIAYLSSVGAAMFSILAGSLIIPYLHITEETKALRELPEIIFKLDIPPIMPVMSALVLALFVGLAAAWTKAEKVASLLDEIQAMILKLVEKIIIPILPFFIATTFAELAYEGTITEHLPVFLTVIILVLVGHFIWLTVLYSIAGLISGENPLEVVKHYLPAYLTAVGTMSSAATLPVSLKSAGKSKVLDKEITNFAIPLGATIHLCGSVLTETFFVMVISKVLYGSVPPLATMFLFALLLGIFAIGAPGVPGGTVMASLGLVTGILGFDQTGVGLVLTIFAIQDSFGTACNITGDGAIALMLSGLNKKR